MSQEGAAPVPRLEARGITKRFPGVVALNQVDLHLGVGEVLAVVGENGAGKSTLMKILAGVQAADEGEVRLDGTVLEQGSVKASLAAGVSLIHQELNLADNLSVAANVMLGREPRKFGLIDHKALLEAAAPSLASVGLDVDPGAPLAELSLGRQQLVEIAKALATDASVLIMDEPTSSLTTPEAERLFEVVDSLRERGVSVIYISHRLGEVKRLADRVLVLRDGQYAGELGRDEVSHDSLVRLMVGRDVALGEVHVPKPPGEVVLDVRGLRTRAYPGEALDFEVRAGELVAIAGLVGAGRTEVLQALFGVVPPLSGEVRVQGQLVDTSRPKGALAAGVALVPEDRKGQGLLLEMTVEENLSLGVIARDAKRGMLNRAAEARLAERMIAELNIKTPTAKQIVRLLSGGNQQKVVLGRWLARGPRVLLLDEPTRGVDVGAKEEIYRLIEDLTADGLCVLFVSSEMEEVLGLADRALVMHEGKLTGELPRAEFSEEAIMQLATRTVTRTA